MIVARASSQVGVTSSGTEAATRRARVPSKSLTIRAPAKSCRGSVSSRLRTCRSTRRQSGPTFDCENPGYGLRTTRSCRARRGDRGSWQAGRRTRRRRARPRGRGRRSGQRYRDRGSRCRGRRGPTDRTGRRLRICPRTVRSEGSVIREPTCRRALRSLCWRTPQRRTPGDQTESLDSVEAGPPGGIRTPDLLIRSQSL